jgi:hypothetical protein
MLYIEPKLLVGRKFSANDPKIEYTCIGYAQNDTCLIVGSYFDTVNNRSELKTVKMTDAKFKGDISLPPTVVSIPPP